MAEMMNLPICPGCGGEMKLEFWFEPIPLPGKNPERWCCFQCECGWQSPKEYADTAHEALEKAYHAAMKRQPEKPPEVLEELTEEEMRVEIRKVCGRFPFCENCPLDRNPRKKGGCFLEGADIRTNYSILKEAGIFDQKAGE